MNRRLSKENLVWLTMRLAALILCAIWTLNLPAAAVEVPFAAPQTIDGAFDGARAVATGDIDGDGDLDVVAASGANGTVRFWGNAVGDGTSWSAFDIDTSFAAARFALPMDVDGDGAFDVVAASDTVG
ncbi:MAG: FG-GAP-like repeat-containing protein, partial [Acidobacteriota bacterium]